MSDLDAVWVKPAIISRKVLDPLGLDRTSDRITSNLLMGIISLTERARYYSFYPWVIKNVNETEEFSRYIDFKNLFFDRARVYCLACISHGESHSEGNHANIQGLMKGRPKWRESGKIIQTQSFRHLGNRLGGYGYYYQASIRNLGLTKQESTRDVLTPLGEQVAKTFEKVISKTRYYEEYIGSQKIPRTVLKDFGSNCCLCRINEPQAPDQNILRKIIFNLIPGSSEDLFLEHEKRKHTLTIILHQVNTLCQHSKTIDEETFLDLTYYKQFKLKKDAITINFPNYLGEIIEKWKIFRCHDYYSYTCETLFSLFLKTLDLHRVDGLSFPNFLKSFEKSVIISELSKSLQTNFPSNGLPNPQTVLLELVTLVFDTKISKFNIEISREFDQNCTLTSPINESIIMSQLEESNSSKKYKPNNTIVLSLLLLLMLFARFYYKYKTNNRSWLWLINRSQTDPSPYHMLREFEDKIFNPKYSIFDFISWIYKYQIISQSISVFNQKKGSSLYSHPRTFFHEDKNVYRIDRIYTPRFRNSRFDSCLSILTDLNLCKYTRNNYKLTSDGVKLLNTIVNG